MQVFTSFDDKVVSLLNEGAVGVLPTDTVYGLVCRAANVSAVERLYGLKAREHKPGTLIAANTEQLVSLSLKPRYIKAVSHFWPGPVSVVIPCDDELKYLHMGLYGIATRVPAHAALNHLLLQTGPLLTSSANPPKQPTAQTMHMAQDYFNDQVDFYVDGGDLSDHQPSTIIKIVDDAIEIIRRGAVNMDETGKVSS